MIYFISFKKSINTPIKQCLQGDTPHRQNETMYSNPEWMPIEAEIQVKQGYKIFSFLLYIFFKGE